MKSTHLRIVKHRKAARISRGEVVFFAILFALLLVLFVGVLGGFAYAFRSWIG